MKINKVIAVLLGVEFAYSLYKIVPSFLVTFSPDNTVISIIVFSIIALLLISAVGIFFDKKWAVITLWVYILLPFLTAIILPLIVFVGGYYFVVMNVIFATYLSGKYLRK